MARGRSARFDGNRESIVRAAAALFAEHGYPGTSMADLARACGISKPLLYHYVSDKYQLLLEISVGHVSRLEALVREVEARGLPAPTRLDALIVRFLDEYARARHAHRVLTQDVKFLEPDDRERVLDTERAIVAAFAAAVAEARPDLGAATLAKPLAMLLFGMMNWMFTWLRTDGRLAPTELAPLVSQLFLGGLAALHAPDPARARGGLADPPVHRRRPHVHSQEGPS